MDSITSLIKNEISRQYRSVRHFSEVSGIPYSTISNALAKGIGGSSYDTVVRICQLLDIKQAHDSDISLFNREFHDVYSKLVCLDEQGLHTVRTVLDVEYNRCINSGAEPAIKAFNGIGYAVRSKNDDVHELVEKVKHHE